MLDFGKSSHHSFGVNSDFDLLITKININAATPSAVTNPKTSLGAIPTNVFVKLLANATAGLAKKVEEVNQ